MMKPNKIFYIIYKLCILGGATHQELHQVLTECQQMRLCGFINNDGFNIIAEQVPAVTAFIADGMNITVGKLRRESYEVRISSDDVFRALESQSERIDKLYNDRGGRFLETACKKVFDEFMEGI